VTKLEAAADPWREAREAIPLHMESGGHIGSKKSPDTHGILRTKASGSK
jgi:hypothetical protein